jgi:NAD(P)H-dependent FMN reductase
MRIAIISGSHRNNSESERVSRYIGGILSDRSVNHEVISLANNPLPLWDEGVWSGDPKWKELWSPISKTLMAATGFVVVAPEWAGMAPPGLKNFFLLCGAKEVGHKPALIVSVSSGVGGSYPIAELRISSYKNNRLVYIPEHVIIRNVQEMLKGDSPADERDEQTRKRIGYGLNLLIEYSKALATVRENGSINHTEFPYGL